MDEVKVKITVIYKSNWFLLSKEYKLANDKNWERSVQCNQYEFYKAD